MKLRIASEFKRSSLYPRRRQVVLDPLQAAIHIVDRHQQLRRPLRLPDKVLAAYLRAVPASVACKHGYRRCAGLDFVEQHSGGFFGDDVVGAWFHSHSPANFRSSLIWSARSAS